MQICTLPLTYGWGNNMKPTYEELEQELEIYRDVIFDLIERDPSLIGRICRQSDDMCLVAMENGGDLRDVNRRTPEICLAAVKQYASHLKYVKDQTEELCLAAIETSVFALKYIENQTEELCLAAARKNLPIALDLIRDVDLREKIKKQMEGK